MGAAFIPPFPPAQPAGAPPAGAPPAPPVDPQQQIADLVAAAQAALARVFAFFLTGWNRVAHLPNALDAWLEDHDYQLGDPNNPNNPLRADRAGFRHDLVFGFAGALGLWLAWQIYGLLLGAIVGSAPWFFTLVVVGFLGFSLTWIWLIGQFRLLRPGIRALIVVATLFVALITVGGLSVQHSVQTNHRLQVAIAQKAPAAPPTAPAPTWEKALGYLTAAATNEQQDTEERRDIVRGWIAVGGIFCLLLFAPLFLARSVVLALLRLTSAAWDNVVAIFRRQQIEPAVQLTEQARLALQNLHAAVEGNLTWLLTAATVSAMASGMFLAIPTPIAIVFTAGVGGGTLIIQWARRAFNMTGYGLQKGLYALGVWAFIVILVYHGLRIVFCAMVDHFREGPLAFVPLAIVTLAAIPLFWAAWKYSRQMQDEAETREGRGRVLPVTTVPVAFDANGRPTQWQPLLPRKVRKQLGLSPAAAGAGSGGGTERANPNQSRGGIAAHPLWWIVGLVIIGPWVAFILLNGLALILQSDKLQNLNWTGPGMRNSIGYLLVTATFWLVVGALVLAFTKKKGWAVAMLLVAMALMGIRSAVADTPLFNLTASTPRPASALTIRAETAMLPSVFRPDFAANLAIVSEELALCPQLANRWETILALIKSESDWDPNAKNPKSSASGLMQLISATQAQYGVSNPFDPRQNVKGGLAFLSDLHARYSGDWAKMLLAYAWGPENVPPEATFEASMAAADAASPESSAAVRRVLGLGSGR